MILFSWLPRGRALPPEVWAARHRGLLLVLAAHLVVLPAFAVTQGWSLQAAWLFDLAPADLRRAGVVEPPVARRALLHVRAGAAVVLGGPRRRLARDARGALPLLRDGRRARALRGVVGVPAGDRLRRAPARRDGRLPRHGLRPRPQPVALGRDPRRLRRRAGRRQPDLLARQREHPRRDGALARALPARVRRRAGRDGAGRAGRPRCCRPTASCASAPATPAPKGCTSGTSCPPTTARSCGRAGRRSPTARRPSAATCAPTARSAGSCGATR